MIEREATRPSGDRLIGYGSCGHLIAHCECGCPPTAWRRVQTLTPCRDCQVRGIE